MANTVPLWPDPPLEILHSPEFEKVWACIKTWDINVPSAYVGYMGATGNHVWAILLALGVLADRRRLDFLDRLAADSPGGAMPILLYAHQSVRETIDAMESGAK